MVGARSRDPALTSDWPQSQSGSRARSRRREYGDTRERGGTIVSRVSSKSVGDGSVAVSHDITLVNYTNFGQKYVIFALLMAGYYPASAGARVEVSPSRLPVTRPGA